MSKDKLFSKMSVKSADIHGTSQCTEFYFILPTNQIWQKCTYFTSKMLLPILKRLRIVKYPPKMAAPPIHIASSAPDHVIFAVSPYRQESRLRMRKFTHVKHF